jgi:hypothetical protein
MGTDNSRLGDGAKGKPGEVAFETDGDIWREAVSPDRKLEVEVETGDAGASKVELEDGKLYIYSRSDKLKVKSPSYMSEPSLIRIADALDRIVEMLDREVQKCARARARSLRV